MSDLQKLQLKRTAPPPGKTHVEDRYWRSFRSTVRENKGPAVQYIHFADNEPHDCAVTSGARVEIYDAMTFAVKKTISRFSNLAHAGTLRDDGTLLAASAAGSSPYIRIFDVKTRPSAPVVLKILSSLTSFQHDDHTVRMWDIVEEKCVHKFLDHEDYVRSADSHDRGSVWATGSYDHTVKLWDIRSKSCTKTLNHGCPVESVLFLPGGSLVLSAGGTEVKVWDVAAGGDCIFTTQHHTKAVTCLARDSGRGRLLTGSADGTVKAVDMGDFSVVFSYTFDAPVVSLAASNDGAVLAAGCANGDLVMRRRAAEGSAEQTSDEAAADESTRRTRRRTVPAGSYRYFTRGQSERGENADVRILPSKRKPKLAPYEQLMRKYRYRETVDAALRTNDPVVICTVLEELATRGALTRALAGRDEASLRPLLAICLRYLSYPAYATILVDVVLAVLEMYASVLGRSATFDELLYRLRDKVRGEIGLQERLHGLCGTLDTLLASPVFS